jgi:4-hydroxyphenylacetate 3-monooxygenase
MALRSGASYLEALKDGREVWLGGERVNDVTAHPQLAGCAASLAENFDLQRNPEYAGLLTSVSPRTETPIGRQWHLPRSSEDLTRGREMYEFYQRRAGGVLGRHPQHMAGVLMGVYGSRGEVATINEEWAENIENHFDYCRESDIALAFAAGEPHRDRKLPASVMDYLKVVESRPDGIIVRGGLMAATNSIYSDEFLSTCRRKDAGQDDPIYFCVPVATEGLKLVCRPSLSHAGDPGHPLASRWDEMDVCVIFDHVFVPRNRIFLLQNDADVTIAGPTTWALWYVACRQVIKSEVLVGLSFGIADYMGTYDVPENRAMLAEAVSILEGLREVVINAERQAIYSEEGLAIPNPRLVALARVIDLQTHTRLLEITRHLCSTSLIIAPSEVEFNHPEIGPLLNHYIAGEDPRAHERFKLSKLAWEYLEDSFAGRQLLFEEHSAGNLSRRRQQLMDNYDPNPVIDLAKQLAGIDVAR